MTFCLRRAGGDPLMHSGGDSSELTLSDRRTDLVFMSMVYHHLGNPAAAARECHRALCDAVTSAFATARARAISRIGISSCCSL
jgi:methyltransferase family protein